MPSRLVLGISVKSVFPPPGGDRNRSRFMLYPANVTTCERLFNGLVVENTNRVRLDRANDPSNVIYELQEINVITKLLQPGVEKRNHGSFSRNRIFRKTCQIVIMVFRLNQHLLHPLQALHYHLNYDSGQTDTREDKLVISSIVLDVT